MQEDFVNDPFATNEYRFTSDLAGQQARPTGRQVTQRQTAEQAADPLATNPLPEMIAAHQGAAKTTSD